MNPTAKKLKETILQAGPAMVLEAFASIARMRSLAQEPDKNKPDWSGVLALINPPKPKLPTSRSERFDRCLALVSEAKGDAEGLRDELQEWHDNMPENMQSGQKADDLDSAISSLEEFINSTEEAEGVSVEFPGMY